MSERRARTTRRSGRARSQHFLRTRFAAELVRDADLAERGLLAPPGAGGGRVTGELARSVRRVVAVELDPQLAEQLRGRWANVDVLEADACEVELPREPFRIVANLPFHGTNEILRHLLDDPRVQLVRADVVVQWGVAVKRGLPWPSTVSGAVWGAWYSTRVARRLPRTAFRPAPSVDAAVLVFERRAQPLVPEHRAADYRRFVARRFRRGQQGNGLEPRQLDAYEWARLFAERSRR